MSKYPKPYEYTSISSSSRQLTKEEIYQEFQIATHGMTFEGEQGEELRQIFYTYFVAGAMWAQDKLAPLNSQIEKIQSISTLKE